MENRNILINLFGVMGCKKIIYLHPLASHFYIIGIFLFGPKLSMTHDKNLNICANLEGRTIIALLYMARVSNFSQLLLIWLDEFNPQK